MEKFEEMQTYGMPPNKLMGEDNKMGSLFGGGFEHWVLLLTLKRASNEWVNAGFNVIAATKSGDTLDRGHYNEWYRINKDGKISFWYNTKANR